LPFLLLAVASASFLVPARAQDDLQVPDLAPRKPFHIGVGAGLAAPGPAIRFSVVSENRGAYALDVVANPAGADEGALVSGQCVAWESIVCVERRPLPAFVFDPAHEHFDFPNFALYEVRKLTPQGTPDMTSAGLVGAAQKISFCLVDSKPNQEDTTFTGFTQTGFYRGCSDVYQGISAGWGNEHASNIIGQEIPIQSIPDGSYALVVTLNTDGVIYETTRANNMSYEKIKLTRYGATGSYAEVTILP
jgi:hypothetical protein